MNNPNNKTPEPAPKQEPKPVENTGKVFDKDKMAEISAAKSDKLSTLAKNTVVNK